MAEITVPTAKLELTPTKLTNSILRQMPSVESSWARDYLPGGKEFQDEHAHIVGWIHGSVLETTETHWHWVIVQLRKGEYRRLRCNMERIRALRIERQLIYIS